MIFTYFLENTEGIKKELLEEIQEGLRVCCFVCQQEFEKKYEDGETDDLIGYEINLFYTAEEPYIASIEEDEEYEIKVTIDCCKVNRLMI